MGRKGEVNLNEHRGTRQLKLRKGNRFRVDGRGKGRGDRLRVGVINDIMRHISFVSIKAMLMSIEFVSKLLLNGST